jgi:RNA polymerase sigma-70 factor, ECF subfamily
VNLPDQEQIDGLISGDLNAFEMLFRTYYQPLCNYAHSYLQDRDEAEEIVQTTFASIWEKRNSISIRSSAKSYLFAMVRNACLNAIKHNKVRQKHVVEEMTISPIGYEAVSEKVESGELETQIHKAMNALPEQCRLVFKLSRFEELKYSEIADQLQISVKTVENHMGKALKIMREQLKDYLPLIILFLTGHKW